MENSHYKILQTPSNLQCRYYFRAPSPGKPTILFFHGFPSSSTHWVNQCIHFGARGYGLISADLIGYGGTSKPDELPLYAGCRQAEDCARILDKEGIDKVIAIGHDWGNRVTSRFADMYPERHIASIFIGSGYIPPAGGGDELIELVKQLTGRDIFGYIKFMAEEDSPETILAHSDSFLSMLYTSDPSYWVDHFSPEGALKKFILADRKAPIAPWCPDLTEMGEHFAKNGWRGPTNWYRVSLVDNGYSEKELSLAASPPVYNHPVLLIGTTGEKVSLPEMTKMVTMQACGGPENCQNFTYKELETGHWPQFEQPAALNKIIEEYIGGL